MTLYQHLSLNVIRFHDNVQILSTDEDHVVWWCKRTLSWIQEILTLLIQTLWVSIISKLLQLGSYNHSFHSDMIISNTFKCAEIWDCSTIKTIYIFHSLQMELLVELWPTLPAVVLFSFVMADHYKQFRCDHFQFYPPKYFYLHSDWRKTLSESAVFLFI